MREHMFDGTQQGTLPCYNYHLPHYPALDFGPACGIFRVPTNVASSVAVSVPSGSYQANLYFVAYCHRQVLAIMTSGCPRGPGCTLAGERCDRLSFLAQIPTNGGSA